MTTEAWDTTRRRLARRRPGESESASIAVCNAAHSLGSCGAWLRQPLVCGIASKKAAVASTVVHPQLQCKQQLCQLGTQLTVSKCSHDTPSHTRLPARSPPSPPPPRAPAPAGAPDVDISSLQSGGPELPDDLKEDEEPKKGGDKKRDDGKKKDGNKEANKKQDDKKKSD